jgi:hypothetical protein
VIVSVSTGLCRSDDGFYIGAVDEAE